MKFAIKIFTIFILRFYFGAKKPWGGVAKTSLFFANIKEVEAKIKTVKKTVKTEKRQKVLKNVLKWGFLGVFYHFYYFTIFIYTIL